MYISITNQSINKIQVKKKKKKEEEEKQKKNPEKK